VLDALLEDPRVEIGAASGASAGAMNAVVLAQGLLEGGRDGARAALQRFWHAVAASLPVPLFAGNGVDVKPHPLLGWLLQWTRVVAPREWNPLGVNPLREIVVAQVDFERLRRERPRPLFVAATEVATGRLRLFREHELTAEMLLASACLPNLHHAVMIDGREYWDGGFVSNPPVLPLLLDAAARDVLVVPLVPLRRDAAPADAAAIQARMHEFAFHTAFVREMALVARLQCERASAWWPRVGAAARIASARVHVIEPPDALAQLQPATRLAAHGDFLEAMHDIGEVHARAWLERHGAAIGRRGTADLGALFGDLGAGGGVVEG
jgi:NTE family protein